LAERQGKLEEAARTLETLLEKHPEATGLYPRLLELLNRLKDDKRHAAWIQKWRQHDADDLQAASAEVKFLSKQDVGKARAAADAYVARQMQKTQVKAKALKGDAKDLEKRRQDLIDGTRRGLQYEMARAFFRGQALAEAEARTQTLLKELPDELALHLLLGDIHTLREDWPKAADVYAKLYAKDKNNFLAANNLAWVLARHLDQPAKALPIVQETRKGRFSQRLLPGDRLRPEFLDTLGLVYQKVNQAELYEDMRKIFEPACKRYSQDARMFLFLGHAYAGLHENAKARQMFESTIALAKSPLSPLSVSRQEEVIREAQLAVKKLDNP
jgi:hypothetical protein